MEDNNSNGEKDDLKTVSSNSEDINHSEANDGTSPGSIDKTDDLKPISNENNNSQIPSNDSSNSQPDNTNQAPSNPIQQPEATNTNTPVNSSIKPVDPGQTLGILSLVFAFLLPLVGLVLGIIGHSKSKKAGYKNGLSIAGIVISIVNIVVFVLFFMAFLGLGFWAVNESRKICDQYGPGEHFVNGTSYDCGTGSIDINSDSINNDLDNSSPVFQEQ